MSLAIDPTARNAHHVVPLRPQLVQHFVYHKNVQRRLGRAAAAIFCSLPPFIHRDRHRYLLCASEILNHRAHSCGSIFAATQAIALPISPESRK
jgi:hypothetical protein